MPDPDAPLPNRERRRTVRQRLHTPVYVSFNSPQSGAVLDLSELLDLHEYGFAVQTAIPAALSRADRLEVNRAVTLCLDLPETKKYVHGSGQVMWTDDTGRAGIRFSFLPDPSRRALKEWLFSNLLVASTNHVARIRQLEQHRQDSRAPGWVGAQAGMLEPRASGQYPLIMRSASELSVHESGHLARKSMPLEHGEPEVPAAGGQPALVPDPEPIAPEPIAPELHAPEPHAPELHAADPHALEQPSPAGDTPADVNSDRTELLCALDDVRREVREMRESAGEGVDLHAALGHENAGANFDPVLHLIVERAASLTSASGAALALLTGDAIICRACIGEPAPPVGSAVDVSTGLSGECLRTGVVVFCGDTESDPRVDPDVCRIAGIGSFMAAPIFADFRVVGLIEVFSPYPYTFAKSDEAMMERLAELVPLAETDSANKKIEARTIESPAAEPEAAVLAAPTGEIERPDFEPAIARESNVIAKPSFEQIPVQLLEEASEQTTGDLTELPRSFARRFPFSHLVLMVMAIAVAAMALGYLLAPTIEQHWLRPAQAAGSAPHTPIAVDRRGQPLSPDDLRKLAEQGDPDAQWQLGILYHDGDGVPKDDAVAMQWYERAAQQGYVRAQSTLGAYYWAGRGVQQDLSKSYFWSQLALAQGDKDSKLRLEGLSAHMTQAQVASARQQAEAWLHAHNQTVNSKPAK